MCRGLTLNPLQVRIYEILSVQAFFFFFFFLEKVLFAFCGIVNTLLQQGISRDRRNVVEQMYGVTPPY